ncbi:MAG TPA: carbamoyl phosphate synthase large subunit, partial [Micavibrio sp.]
PVSGTVFLSVKDSDKNDLIPIARDLTDMGFKLVATGGTCTHLKNAGLDVMRINKVMEGQPHIVDAIINGQIDFMINTTRGPQAIADATSIRRQALTHKIPYYTLLTAARAGVQAIQSMRTREIEVRPIQDYLREKTEAAA